MTEQCKTCEHAVPNFAARLLCYARYDESDPLQILPEVNADDTCCHTPSLWKGRR